MSEVIAKAMAEATWIMIQTMAETQSRVEETKQGPKIGSPVLKQPQFNWDATDKYPEWKAFMLEVKNVLSTYNTPEYNKIAIVKNWLGRKRLHYIVSITETEKQACNTLQGLFDTLATKFWPQFKKTIKLLQFRKLCRSENESAEEWMGWLWMAAAECGYKEVDRQLKEQFIHGLNDKIMLDEIIRELTSKTANVKTTSEDVLVWAKRVEAQRAQAVMLNDITEIRAFDKIKRRLSQRISRKEKCRLQHTKDSHADTAGNAMFQDNAQLMGKCVQHVARWGTSGRCAGAKETVQSMKWE